MLGHRGSRSSQRSPLLRLSALVGTMLVVFEGTWQEQERRGGRGVLSLVPSTRAVGCAEEPLLAQQSVAGAVKTGKGNAKAKSSKKRSTPKRIWLWNTSVQDLKRGKWPKYDRRRSTWLSKGTADTLFKALKIAGEAFQTSAQPGDVAPHKVTGNPSIWRLSSKATVRYLTLESAENDLIGKHSPLGFGFNLSGFLSVLLASVNVASPVYEATFATTSHSTGKGRASGSAGKRMHTFSQVAAPLETEESSHSKKKKNGIDVENLGELVGKEVFYGSVFFTSELSSFWAEELQACILESYDSESNITKKPNSPPFEGLEVLSQMEATGKKPLRLRLKSVKDFWDLVAVMEFLAKGSSRVLLSCTAKSLQYVKDISGQLESFRLGGSRSNSLGSVIIYRNGTAVFVDDDVLGEDVEKRKLQLRRRSTAANNILKAIFTGRVKALKVKKRRSGKLIFLPALANWEQLVEEKSVQEILLHLKSEAIEDQPVVREHLAATPGPQ